METVVYWARGSTTKIDVQELSVSEPKKCYHSHGRLIQISIGLALALTVAVIVGGVVYAFLPNDYPQSAARPNSSSSIPPAQLYMEEEPTQPQMEEEPETTMPPGEWRRRNYNALFYSAKIQFELLFTNYSFHEMAPHFFACYIKIVNWYNWGRSIEDARSALQRHLDNVPDNTLIRGILEAHIDPNSAPDHGIGHGCDIFREKIISFSNQVIWIDGPQIINATFITVPSMGFDYNCFTTFDEQDDWRILMEKQYGPPVNYFSPNAKFIFMLFQHGFISYDLKDHYT